MATKQELLKEIQDLLSKAQTLVYQAESIADEHGLSFSANFGGYGMGGYYEGGSEGELDEYGDEIESGWRASSQSC